MNFFKHYQPCSLLILWKIPGASFTQKESRRRRPRKEWHQLDFLSFGAMKLLMKADRDGGIPAFARLLDKVLFTNDIWTSGTWTSREFSRELNKVLRFLVQSNMEGFSVFVVQVEPHCFSDRVDTSRTRRVGFLRPDKNSIFHHSILRVYKGAGLACDRLSNTNPKKH